MAKSSTNVNDKGKPPKEEMEFGGTFGALFIMLCSHVILFYVCISLKLYNGELFAPWNNIDKHVMFISEKMWPTSETWMVYLSFVAIETLFAWLLPGFKVEGLPVPSLNGQKLLYNCNGYIGWWLSQILLIALHYMGIFPIDWISQNLGKLVTTVVIFADVVAVVVYVMSLILGLSIRMSGSHIYDFFMGASLNPRIGSLDIKMWAETRVSWITLFFLTLSAAIEQYHQIGYVTGPMAFMVVSHWLYTNGCAKGEEMIPISWDFFHEKWGWMLCYWNLAGVPMMYCWNSYYILHNPQNVSTGRSVLLFVLLFIQYYIWDTANSQKCAFRMQLRGIYRDRPWYIFPKLPWKVLNNPVTIKTEAGSPLLVDGWYKYARKLHYTMDIFLAFLWGIACGMQNFLPYCYFVFMTVFLVHRWKRDDKRCAVKYGKDWEKYKKKVPYVFIPYVI